MKKAGILGPICAVTLLAACSGGEDPAQDTAAQSAAAEDLGPPPPAEEAGPAAATASAAEAAPAAETATVIDGIENRRVSFAPGASSAIVEDSITGDQSIDYLLNVKAGQPLNISMAAPDGRAFFNVLEPGEEYVGIFTGSSDGGQFEGVAAKSGDYRIRVYQMRVTARRGETASYRLEMIAG